MKILLDALGYFTGTYVKIGNIENGVEVESIPEENDNLKIKSYRLENNQLVFDEERYKILKEEDDKRKEEESKKLTLEDVISTQNEILLALDDLYETSNSDI